MEQWILIGLCNLGFMVKVVEVRKLRIFLFSKCEKGFEDKHWLSFLQVFFIIVYFTCALFRIEEWWRSELVEHKQNTAINFRQNSILVDSVIFFESVHLFLRFSKKLTRYEKMEIRVFTSHSSKSLISIFRMG